ncbi:MAG: helix-turn-helix domain-containing protein [Alphaproteobacteria bacterium]|nr:helix-turn-helix domain-containing protein [Alphaproteobacteria bacterium]MBT4017093.1 helix-turn-helix domain-containing protein [Alphaproteobacteria bacterium]MBT4546057.1 helix-turn-helix domain-containing protein [Alphaproteobacteria bacterium]MBT7745073.1 helix-turn-helix domain-containing protein [Alphaproteobacteria bacterium]
MTETRPSSPSPVLSPKDAARLLGISSRTLARLVKRREIAFVRVGGSLRFKPDDLRAFVDQNRTSRHE